MGIRRFKKGCWALFIVIAVFSSASLAAAAQLVSMGHLEVLGAYSEIIKGDNNTGTELSGFFSPVIKFNDTLFLIPLYSADLQRVEQYLPEEGGNILYNTYFVNNFNLALRKEFTPGWFVKFGPLGTWNFVRETHSDKWGRGLYDYRDAGFSAEIKHRVAKEEAVTIYLGAFEYYRRQYPNFATLISATTVTPPERREKDFDGYKETLRLEQTFAGGQRWYAQGYFLDKRFLDKHLVLEDGTLDTGRHRADYEITCDAGFSSPLPCEKISVFLDNSYTHNVSNMDYYDSRNTLTLADDVYTSHYFSYDSYTVSPALEFAQPMGEKKILKLRLGYSYLHRAYAERKSQDRESNYLAKDQVDTQNTYFATLSFPLTRHFSWITRYSFTHADSNQEYEQFYRYKYNTYQIKSGIALDF